MQTNHQRSIHIIQHTPTQHTTLFTVGWIDSSDMSMTYCRGAYRSKILLASE